ncbi:penicillin-binding protein 2 [Prochlorococcus sp. MIT 1300]|uniref:penicillin-binding protein 2 n=1 Tax=Prochlorococcus sp. MIT 1300 TaxID=3096218 RepID=UPI002A7532BD|nr:penicillin-binding protein 2 [Prochlorococcus sp. MIT 1300]
MAKKPNYSGISNQRNAGIYNQSTLFLLLILFFCSAISGRLFWLQVLKGNKYREMSEQNRIRLVARSPMRGRLLDRNGEVLASNKLRYNLYIKSRLIRSIDWPSMKESLSNLLKIDSNLLENRFQLGLDKDKLRITLATDLTPQQVLRFKEQSDELLGAQVDIEVVRFYPHRTLAAHVLGYTQPITNEEFKVLSSDNYVIQDRIGRTGLEAAYESHLRGEWGGEMLEVDAVGTIQRSLGQKSAIPGKDLTLTIDLDLQKAAEDALATKRAGAIVALDPRTGAVLAMASRPGFDPNFFSKFFTSQKEYDQLFLSSQKPLFSRAVNSYDPGSTWKPVTAVAGMETGKYPSDVVLMTTSCIKYGSHCFYEYNRRGFGKIGYEDALRFSSNTFFYQIGIGVGSKALYKAAKQLGFDALTGIELSYEESKGIVGNEEWAEKGRGWGEPGKTPWIPEDMASASIGQAVVQITPLQLARAYAVFANGGYLITPHLAARDIDWYSSKRRRKVRLKPSTLETIRKGLRKVVEIGTAAPINLPHLPKIAGKTGTAEDSTGGNDHAWFACFAPYENSEIVVVAFAQNTPGGGSVHALPMARQVLEAWNQGRVQSAF